MKQEPETLTFKSAKAFDLWLASNYQHEPGVWVKVAKVSSGIPSITSDELVDVGLCWGWISGQRKSLNNSYYLQKYVPRRPRSIWSQVNVDKVETLTKAGKMQLPGIKQVKEAKVDGRWQAAYASQRNAVVPADLVQALAKNKAAADRFKLLNKTDRYAIIMKLEIQRNPEGRAALLNKLVLAMANQKS